MPAFSLCLKEPRHIKTHQNVIDLRAFVSNILFDCLLIYNNSNTEYHTCHHWFFICLYVLPSFYKGVLSFFETQIKRTTSPCEGNIMNQPKEIIDLWIDLCEKICQREDLLS